MYTFANVFAMQLEQVTFYDGVDFACSSASSCSGSDKYTDASNAQLVNYDGYIYPEDQYAIQYALGITGTCSALSTTITYITNIADGLTKSGVSTTSDSTSIISDSKTAVCATITALYTACASDSDCETACTASNC